MAILSSQSRLTYLAAIIFILLDFRSPNLMACPLPPSECEQCHVLNFINSMPNNASNITLSTTINLLKAINKPEEVARHLVRDNHPSLFFRTNQFTNSCSSTVPDSGYSGSPCDKTINMTGSLPSCSWNYVCDYSPNRFPQIIWKAECGPGSEEIKYPVPTLTLHSSQQGGCEPFQGTNVVYRWGQESVPVACICTDAISK